MIIYITENKSFKTLTLSIRASSQRVLLNIPSLHLDVSLPETIFLNGVRLHFPYGEMRKISAPKLHQALDKANVAQRRRRMQISERYNFRDK